MRHRVRIIASVERGMGAGDAYGEVLRREEWTGVIGGVSRKHILDKATRRAWDVVSLWGASHGAHAEVSVDVSILPDGAA